MKSPVFDVITTISGDFNNHKSKNKAIKSDIYLFSGTTTLYTFLQILEVNLFEKKPIFSLVAEALKQISDSQDVNQLNLYNY